MSELRYLLGGHYLANGVMNFHFRTEIPQGVGQALSAYEDSMGNFLEKADISLCNEGTYELHEEAEIRSWVKLFSSAGLRAFMDFCDTNDFVEASKAIRKNL